MAEQSDERWGLLKGTEETRSLEEIAGTLVRRHPIELEERITTLDRPLIIECACPGWQPKIWPRPEAYGRRRPPNYQQGGIRYPAVPCSLEDQAAEMVAAVREGCAIAHIHPRDPKDCFASESTELLAEVYERVFKQTDAISIQHTWSISKDGGIDFLGMARQAVEIAGGSNRYVQGALVLWPPADSYPRGYQAAVREALNAFHEYKIRPIHKVRGPYNTRDLHRFLADSGLRDEPIVLIHDMGHPFGWPMDIDPWMPVEMISALEQAKRRFAPGSVFGVYSGGRNWMPITMTAILIGADVVRVGIEDSYWMYPHTDEVIRSNMEMVRKITEFCKLVGRRLATPQEAREIMGIVRT